MKSATLPSFWTAYAKLEKDIKQHVKKHISYGRKILFIHLCISNASTTVKGFGRCECRLHIVQLASCKVTWLLGFGLVNMAITSGILGNAPSIH